MSFQFDDIFLLSIEEWENAVATVPNIPVEQNGRWWLRSPGIIDNFAAYVSGYGCVLNIGSTVDRELGVRPAFRISHLSSNSCKPGDKITVGSQTVCTVISDDCVLADDIVCQHQFDSKDNIWANSELKSYVNSKKFKKLL